MSEPRIYKGWLLDMVCENWHTFIEENWPKGIRGMTIFDFIRKASLLDVTHENIDFVVLEAAPAEWDESHVIKHFVSRVREGKNRWCEADYKIIHALYLHEFGGDR